MSGRYHPRVTARGILLVVDADGSDGPVADDGPGELQRLGCAMKNFITSSPQLNDVASLQPKEMS